MHDPEAISLISEAEEAREVSLTDMQFFTPRNKQVAVKSGQYQVWVSSSHVWAGRVWPQVICIYWLPLVDWDQTDGEYLLWQLWCDKGKLFCFIFFLIDPLSFFPSICHCLETLHPHPPPNHNSPKHTTKHQLAQMVASEFAPEEQALAQAGTSYVLHNLCCCFVDTTSKTKWLTLACFYKL